MENNSKCALKINQIISTITILVVLGTSIQLFNIKQNNIEIAKEKDIQEQVQLAQSYERDAKVTTRSDINRTLENNEQEEKIVKYKTIEEIEISRNMDLTISCGVSKEDFNKLLENLKADTSNFFKRNSNVIYELCAKYEINELFFCGLIAAESGWNIAPSHRNSNNYISMMSGGKLIKYASETEGLEAAAKLLHDKYLTEDGIYYSGKTLSDVQRRFCPGSSTWVGLVYGCMSYII